MAQEDNSPWQYKSDSHSATGTADSTKRSGGAKSNARSTESVKWQASEYIEHPHGAGWYALLGLVTIALTVVVFFVTGHDYVATAIMAIVGVIVGVFAGHKPRQVEYEISDTGLSVGDKRYPYSDFKSFAVMHDEGLVSVNLFPLKRLMPPVSAYFAPTDEEKIVRVIGDYLPYEERKMDTIDRLSRRLRL
ncbi:MAG TPA: hypothetical protein VFP32_01115 [Candidatus Saccharimonadales bacterium]|nr:hypothetical protein [Candidatus Saccharimonadales bacterium]